MVAGDPEPDPSASECVNFLDLFDIGAGAPCFFRGLTLSGTKTHVKQRFLPLTPLLMVSDVLWSPVLPA